MAYSLNEADLKTGYLPSKDHTPLFFRHYRAPGAIASILLVHGFGEHSGRYAHVVEALKRERFEVWSIDLRGHGHSEGPRGDTEHFGRYEEDVVAGLEHIQKTSAPKKLFLLGHSMGALISLRVAARGLKLSGLVLSCPLIGLKMKLPLAKKWASLAIARVIPQLRVKSSIKGRFLTSDLRFSEAYDHDPMILKNLSIRAFREIYRGFQNTAALAKDISSSLLLQVAGNDHLVDSEAAKNWFSRIDDKKVDATLKVYPHFMHEIYNESDRHISINDMVYWLKQRI